jgi:predicted nucleic acid-binding Zn ribbon protein
MFLSKFDRYKKKEELFIYPHTHCDKCGKMIEGAHKFCSDCYEQMIQKKKKKWYRFRKRKEQA